MVPSLPGSGPLHRSRVMQAVLLAMLGFTLPFVDFASGQEGRSASLPDPFPLQRILVPASRLPLELEKVRQGILTPMPREEFEARVQKAARATSSLKNRPTLVHARYVAQLNGTALRGRSGIWKIQGNDDTTGVLPLPSFNLALGSIKDSTGADAILGELDGSRLGLLVPQSLEAIFDWSARGTPRADGLAFDLRVPPALTGSLELLLPADMVLVCPGSLPVTGPRDAELKDHKTWLVQIGGKSQIELIVRHLPEGEKAGQALAQVQSRIQVMPRWIKADYDFQIDLLRSSQREFAFLCDATLDPYEVVAPSADVQGWDVREEKVPDPRKKGAERSQKRLTVRFREPVKGTINGLKIRCLGSWSSDQPWTAPGIRLLGGTFRGETIKLQFFPEVPVQEWDPGAFRVSSTAAEPDGGHTIHLVTSLVQLSDGSRPSARLKIGAIECHAKQKLAWRIGADHHFLEVESMPVVAHGSLQRLRFVVSDRITPWSLVKVEMEPMDLLASHRLDGAEVEIELGRPLLPAESPRCKILMKRDSPRFEPKTTIDFPVVTLLDATTQEGELSVFLGDAYQARVLQSSVPEDTRDRTRVPRIDQTPPVFEFPFRNLGVTGKLELVARPAEFSANLRQQIDISPDKASAVASLEIEPAGGLISSVDLLATPFGLQWQVVDDTGEGRVRFNRVPQHDMAHLAHLLGSAMPFDFLAAAGSRQGEWWRATFAAPLRDKSVLTLATQMDRGEAGEWALPVIIAPKASRRMGRIETKGDSIGAIEVLGAHRAIQAAQKGTMAFVLEDSPFPPRLLAKNESSSGRRGPETLCDHARLTSHFEPGQVPLHQLRFRLWGWTKPHFPVFLPEAEDVIAIKVNGQPHKSLSWIDRIGGIECQVPSVAGPMQQVEILYRGDKQIGDRLPWINVNTIRPVLPVEPLWWERRFRLHPDLTFWSEQAFERVDGLQPTFAGKEFRNLWHVADHLPEEIRLLAPTAEPGLLPRLVTLEAGVRARFIEGSALGDYLADLLLASKEEMRFLIVDVSAVERAAITPRTKLGVRGENGQAPLWESFGLTILSTREGLLLTTQAKVDEIKNLGGQNWPAQFEEAIAQARRWGQDSTGSARSLGFWLLGWTPGLIPRTSGSMATEDAPATLSSGWTEYRFRHASVIPSSIRLAYLPALHWLGGMVAVASILGLLLLLSIPCSGTCKFRWAMAGTVGMLVLFLNLPALARASFIGPLAIWIAFLGALYVRALLQPRAAVQSTGPSTKSGVRSAVAVSTLLLILGWQGTQLTRGQPAKAEASIVLLVQNEGEESQTALVAPELLKKLDAVSNQARPRTVRALLLGAGYKATCRPGRFEIKATFDLQSDVDSSILHLPLAGVDLQEGVLLNNAPAFPVPTPGVKGGYSLPIHGRGVHRLEMSFTSRPLRGSDFQELRFSIPKLARAELTLTSAPELGIPVLLAAQGLETLKLGGGKSSELTAQLGREEQVVVRFPTDQPPAPTPLAEVREMYFWDLRPLSLNLTGILQYQVAKGALDRIELDLPEGMEVRGVDLVSAASGPASGPTSLLRRWFFTGKGARRLLHIESTAPMSGKFRVQLSLIPPIHVASANLGLRLPLPLKVKVAESSLAYRVEGFRTREAPHNLTFTVIGEEQFAVPWRSAGQKESVEAFSRAVTFRRSSTDSGFNLSLSPPQASTSNTLNWRIGDRDAYLDAALRFSTSQEIGLLECHVPSSVHVTKVSGMSIHHWSRKGEQLQVWLQQPASEGTLTITAWKGLEKPVATESPGRVALPTVTLKDYQLASSTLSLRAKPGIIFDVESVKGLKPRDLDKAAHLYDLVQEQGLATVSIRRTPVTPWSIARTTIERRGGAWRVRLNIVSDVPHAGKLELATFDGRMQSCDFVSSSGVRLASTPGGDKSTWTILPQKNALRPFHFEVACTASDTVMDRLPIPRLRMLGERPLREELHVDTNARPQKSSGLVAVKAGEGRSTGWRLDRDHKDPVYLEAVDTPLSPRLSLPLAQRHSGRTEEGRWLHQIVYLVHAQDTEQLRFKLPDRGRLRAVVLDGLVVPPQSDAETWSLAIPPGKSWRRLQIFWDEGEGAEPKRLALDSPVIFHLPQPFIAGSVCLHQGWKGDDTFVTQAKVHLACAESVLNLARNVAKDQDQNSSSSPRELLSLARQHLRCAQMGCANVANREKVMAQITMLKKETEHLDALQPTNTVEKTKKQEGDMFPLTLPSAPLQAPLLHWQQDRTGRAPVVSLEGSDISDRSRFRVTGMLLVGAFALFILSFLRKGSLLLQATWPEQWLLLGLAGTLAWGPSLLGALLMLTGVSARLARMAFRLGIWAWRIRRRGQSREEPA